MKTPRRRERDESRVFKKMGDALNTTHINTMPGDPNDPDSVQDAEIKYDSTDRYPSSGSAVKLKRPMDELERKKRNAREDRRVEQTKSGFLAQSGSGWAESQAKGEKRPVVKIDSGK